MSRISGSTIRGPAGPGVGNTMEFALMGNRPECGSMLVDYDDEVRLLKPAATSGAIEELRRTGVGQGLRVTHELDGHEMRSDDLQPGLHGTELRVSRRYDRQDLGHARATALRPADGALPPSGIVSALRGDLLPEVDLQPGGAPLSPPQAVA